MSFDEAKLEPLSTTSTTGIDDLSSITPVRQSPAEWIDLLEGIRDRLEAGGRVADVHCRDATMTIRLAQAFPKSRFFGFDPDETRIEAARQSARRGGVGGRTYFQLGAPVDFPGWGFDLVTFYGGLLTLPNPGAATARVRTALAPGGSWLIVERQADVSALREVVATAGFRSCRQVTRTDDRAVFEIRV
jgi:ubiquinone/menaquinone biosynthesis C-methylase UbiE